MILALELPGGGFPESLELTCLQDAEEFHLNRALELSDFIEEDRPAGGAYLEPTDAVLQRSSEGALAMAEELGLE